MRATAASEARAGVGGTPAPASGKVVTDGRHLLLEGAPFRVKGVSYGSFTPRLDGEPYPDPTEIKRDLVEMAAAGVNVVRTYTLPPPELLDTASELGLHVLVGLDFRDWRYEAAPGAAAHRRVVDAGLREVERALRRCAGRREVLAIAVGNEVPCDVVRAHGVARVEEGLSRLVAEVHRGEPDMLATYCNFPTTEFLQVADQDLVCFNVFLENPRDLRRYLAHLQALSQDRPVIVSELGLASNLHGEAAQAHSLEEQLRAVDECGLAGAAVFSWTDEWGVDGHQVEGWDFGVTDRDRRPKQALDVVRQWAATSICDLRAEWPKVSVVVCVYNGARLLGKCLASLAASDYPALEVIVCDDGSTDDSAAVAREFPFDLLTLERVGLSRARNEGIVRATGEIVAFLDADAFCHPEWPYHLALSLEAPNVMATGGPNLPVADAALVENAVAQAPGAPMEVLVGDDRAEHVPGCNMAYAREALIAVGGFNRIYTAAGDDVDVCWKILDRGWEIGFSPAAQVRHHRRDTVRGYLRQQRGYGKAEALLAPHHPHRFNRLGQARWSGFVYGGPSFLPRLLRPLVYHGYSGTAPYQPIARRRSEAVRDWGVALVPLLVLAAVAGLCTSVVSAWWLVPAALATAALAGLAVFVAAGVRVAPGERVPLKLRALVAYFHLAQPLVRTWGRVRTRAPSVEPEPVVWTGDRVKWLYDVERVVAAKGHRARLGDVHAEWDVEVWRWSFVSWRVTTAVLWGWEPVSRVRPAVRPAAFWGTAGALGGFSLLSGWGVVAAGAAVVLAAVETLRVRRALLRALAATTTPATS